MRVGLLSASRDYPLPRPESRHPTATATSLPPLSELCRKARQTSANIGPERGTVLTGAFNSTVKSLTVEKFKRGFYGISTLRTSGTILG